MKKYMSFGLAMLFAALFVTVAQAEVVSGKSYYTRVNIWYQVPERIFSTNYHVGSILPAGSLIKAVKVGKDYILFSDEKGITYKITYMAQHSTGTMASFLAATFSEENILAGEEYKKLSEMEKGNISKGIIAEGMSKPAVLMAYGYPPSHRTQSTDMNAWTYWENRFVTKLVTFSPDSGLVTQISR